MVGTEKPSITEGLSDVGVMTQLGYEKLVFFQILTISRAESLINRFGLQDFIESVDALYSLVYPYIVDNEDTQGEIDKALGQFNTELDALARGDPNFKSLASNQAYIYAKAKYRYLLAALKLNGFLPQKATSFIEQ